MPADAAETALLAPYPGAVRADMLDGSWRPPAGDASGRDRAEAKRALALLAEAGDQLDGTSCAKPDGTPFRFEIMVRDRRQERLALAFADSLQASASTRRCGSSTRFSTSAGARASTST